MNANNTHLFRQQGIAMPVALMFLLVTTLIGLSTLQTNLFGEKMTLNNIQREIALEAAEGTLIEGETFARDFSKEIIEQVVQGITGWGEPTTAAATCSATLNGQGGLCVNVEVTAGFTASPSNALENWIDITGNANSINAWADGSGKYRVATAALTNKYKLNTAPRYIVEFMGYVAQRDASSNCLPAAPELLSWPYCPLDRLLFRVTALATAGNYDETRVMLQSTYVVDQ